MQHKIVAFYKKVIASLVAIFLSFGFSCGGDEVVEIVRGEINTASAYDTDNADYTLSIDAADEVHEISDLLYGIFFEDINFAADGGLYAEMVINRSFEYGKLAADDEFHGWSKVGEPLTEVIKDDKLGGLNENNRNYLVITNTTDAAAGVQNRGFLDGMAIKENGKYYFSVYAKDIKGGSADLTVNLVADGKIAATGKVADIGTKWQKYELELTSELTATSNVYLQVLTDCSKVALDMVSLFPETYKGHGMRTDLAQKLADLEPAFLRFPGGCVIEGYDSETAYNWKDSIGVGEDGLPVEFEGRYGDVATRTYGINLWTDVNATEDPLPCYMSYGLGFYEYFQLAEDIGAIGVPVINCGLYCQMRGKGPIDMYTAEFEQYLQDMVDLVEFCRGDETTTWGKVRASLGHPEPFELKYIGIGNENENEAYFERYEAFLERFNEEKAKNPELYEGIELIYSSGADDATSGENYMNSYENAYDYVKENGITIDEYAGVTDQHYYNDPSWFLANTDYYDEENYKRDTDEMLDTGYGGAINVFLGEYAARSNRLEAALAEAAYMTGLERNGDIVKMAAYAPLFGNLTATHWAPDLIWFNNSLSTGSISYYMQKLFSTNAGTALLATQFEGAQLPVAEAKGRVGVGTWYTSAQFDNVKVVNNENGRTLGKDSFLPTSYWWGWTDTTSGEWEVSDGKLVQKSTWMADNHRGAVTYFGDTEWTDYTYTVEATKLDGSEGFIIPFAAQDTDNYWFWNIGGWGNTVSCLQQIEDGVKTGRVPGTTKPFTVETGRTYEIKVVVEENRAKGYIDGELMFDKVLDSGAEAECYQVVSTDENGDIIIKLVNVTDSARTVAVDIKNAEVNGTATVYQVAGDDLGNDNILGAPEDCIMEEFTVDGIKAQFNYTVPMYSATVIRISK